MSSPNAETMNKNMNKNPASGTVLQCKALAATADPSMLELLRALLLKNDGNYTDILITLKKTITLGDIITLDRAVNMDILSVVHYVMRIDPAGGEANFESLRKVLLNLHERLRSNIPRRIQEASLSNYFVAPFRQRPLPKLLTEHQAKTATNIDAAILPSETGVGVLLADDVNDSLFICSANPQVNIRLEQVTTNSGDLAADIDFRRGLIKATGDSAASALELMSPDRSGQKMCFPGDFC